MFLQETARILRARPPSMIQLIAILSSSVFRKSDKAKKHSELRFEIPGPTGGLPFQSMDHPAMAVIGTSTARQPAWQRYAGVRTRVYTLRNGPIINIAKRRPTKKPAPSRPTSLKM